MASEFSINNVVAPSFEGIPVSITNKTAGSVTLTIDTIPVTLKPNQTTQAAAGATLAGSLGSAMPANTPITVDPKTIPPDSEMPGLIPGPLPMGPEAEETWVARNGDSAAAQGTPARAATLDTEVIRTVDGGSVDVVAIVDKPTDLSTDKSTQSQKLNDPVDPFTGAFTITETDVVIPGGAWDLVFSRNYQSAANFAGPLGWNWDHNHNHFVRELVQPANAYARWTGQLHEDVFEWDPLTDQCTKNPSGVFDLFEKDAEPGVKYKISRPDGTVERYNTLDVRSNNRYLLDTITDPYGNVLQYTYDTESQLSTITDVCSGRSLYFGYGGCGLLENMHDDYGRTWLFYHDPDIEHHIGVKCPPTEDYPNGYMKVYEYSDDLLGDPKLAHSIARCIDGDGNTYIENEYDIDPSSPSYARVVAQLVGGQPYRYEYEELQYVSQNPDLWDVQVRTTSTQLPDGGVRSYVMNYRGDVLEERLRLVKDGSFTVLVNSYEYDKWGNLTKHIFPSKAGIRSYLVYEYVDPTALDVRWRGRLVSVTQYDNVLLPSAHRVLWEGEYYAIDDFTLLKYSYDEYPTPLVKSQFRTEYQYDGFNSLPFLLKKIFPTVLLADGVTSQTAEIDYTQYAAIPGKIETTTDPRGKITKNTFGGTGESNKRLASVIADFGGLNSTTVYTYKNTAEKNYGHPITETDPTSIDLTTEFNAQGHLRRTALPAVAGKTGEVINHFDTDGFVIATDAPRGDYVDGGMTDTFIRTEIERDLQKYVTRITYGSNTSKATSVQRDVDYRGMVTRSADPTAVLMLNKFDERQLLLETRSKGTDGTLGPKSRYIYDGVGNRTFAIQDSGNGVNYNVTEYTYDAFQRLTAVQESDGVSAHFFYEWVNNSDPSVLLHGNENNNRLVRKEVWDLSSLIVARVIEEYDKRGRLIIVRTAEFNGSQSNPTTFLTTKFYYDQNDNLTKIVDPRGGNTLYEYDALNRLTKVTDPVGNIRLMTYDLAARLLSLEIKDVNAAYPPPSLTTTYQYDTTRKRLVSVTTPDSVVFSQDYDDRNLIVKTTEPTTYDASSVDTTYSLGIFGETLSQTVDPGSTPHLNLTSTWSYDTALRLTAFTDPLSKQTAYNYDTLGRPSKTTYPSGLWESYGYDEYSRLGSQTFSSGSSIALTYYEVGLLEQMDVTAGSGLQAVGQHNFSYDVQRRLTSASVGTYAVSRIFDSLSRMTSETTGGVTITQAYTTLSGFIDRTWPVETNPVNWRTERYTLNLNSVPTGLTRTHAGALGAGVTNLLSITKLIGPDRIKAATQLGPTIVMTGAYDEQRRLKQFDYLSGGLTHGLRYRYDSRSQRRAEVVIETGTAGVDRYTWHQADSRGRLTQSKTVAGPIVLAHVIDSQADHDWSLLNEIQPGVVGATPVNFGYNSADTRSTYSDINGGLTVTSDNDHRLSGTKTSPGNVTVDTFSYVATGTRSADGTRTYDVDALGRVVKVQDKNSTAHLSISYDALGRPRTLDDGNVRDLHYFGMELVQEELNGVLNRQYSNHPLLGRIASHVTGNSFQHLYDARGNDIAVLDSTGALREVHRYSDFGVPTVTLVGATTGIEPIFGGMRYLNIPGTLSGAPPIAGWPQGLYLGMYRLLDPYNGVWLSQDGLGYTDGPNLSAYVGQSPMDYIDPLGLSKDPFAGTGFEGYTNGGLIPGSALDKYRHPGEEKVEQLSQAVHTSSSKQSIVTCTTPQYVPAPKHSKARAQQSKIAVEAVKLKYIDSRPTFGYPKPDVDNTKVALDLSQLQSNQRTGRGTAATMTELSASSKAASGHSTRIPSHPTEAAIFDPVQWWDPIGESVNPETWAREASVWIYNAAPNDISLNADASAMIGGVDFSFRFFLKGPNANELHTYYAVHAGPIVGIGAGVSLVPEWYSGSIEDASASSFLGSGHGAAVVRGSVGASANWSGSNGRRWFGVGPSFGLPSLSWSPAIAGGYVWSRTYYAGQIRVW